MRLVDKMFGTLYATDNGLALAAPQIGVQKQVFVWDFGDEPMVVFNPQIAESDGEWVYEEGCLSIPGLYVEMVRPKQVLLRGIDVEGNPVEWEADELEARMFQHELDHLHGVLMFDRMTPEQRREAMAEYRRLQEVAAGGARPTPPAAPALIGVPCAWRSSARRRWPSRRCGRSSPPATMSSSWSPVPTVAGAAASATSASPVKAAALELGLAVTDEIDDLLRSDAELGVVVAYGRIIKPHVLAAVPMVNVHFSLLPRWRGAAPVERALLAGDGTTGVCIMDVEETLDTGGVYAVRGGAHRSGDDRRRAARRRSSALGTELLVDVLAAPLPEPRPQVGEPTYAEKVASAELELAWSRPAIELDRWVRVGGSWTTFRGRRLKVHRAELASGAGRARDALGPDGTVGTGDGTLHLVVVQPEGRPPMPWADFANGARPQPGERLGG